MTEQEHANLLRDFFCSIFNPKDKVYLFAGLTNESNYKSYSEKVANDCKIPTYKSERIHERELSYRNPNWYKPNQSMYVPRVFLDGFQRQANSTQKDVISKLNDFNRLGYDIYFCINPLTCKERCQRTVFRARTILIEADHSSLEEQMAVLEIYKKYFYAIQFTGNKSYHAYAGINPSLINYQCVGWATLNKNKQLKKEPMQWPEHSRYARLWENELANNNIICDSSSIMDCSKLSRVPEFINTRSGKPSTVIFLNKSPVASQVLKDKRLAEDLFSNIIDFKDDSAIADNNHFKEENGICNVLKDSLINNLILDDIGDSRNLNSSVEKDKIQTDSFAVRERKREERDTGETIVVHNEESISDNMTFLDHYKAYSELNNKGITNRGERRKYHVTMFDMAKLFKWDNEDLVEHWKAILSKEGTKIGLSVEAAALDLLADRDARNSRPTLYLPNTLSLPVDPTSKNKALLCSLKAMDCCNHKTVAKIIINLIWKSIRELPFQCREGKLNIHSKELRKISVNYRLAMEWMAQHKIIEMADPEFTVGQQTRKYLVNIALILCLMGFSTDEISWDTANGTAEASDTP